MKFAHFRQNPKKILSKMSHALALANFSMLSKVQRPGKASKTKKKQTTSVGFGVLRKEPPWRCVEGCGACCKLDKDSSFASSEEIFTNPSDIELYRSMIGPDGWCIHYEKSTRKCSIYSDRPYFCRVETEVFQTLYGISNKKFNKEACSSCRDTIKAIHGPNSKELDNFNCSIRNTGNN